MDINKVQIISRQPNTRDDTAERAIAHDHAGRIVELEKALRMMSSRQSAFRWGRF